MTATDPTHVIVVKVLRDTRGLGLNPVDLVTGSVDELYAAGLITDGEIDLAYADVEARINRLWSNGSPCWECGRTVGEIAWDEDLSEYRHGVCPT